MNAGLRRLICADLAYKMLRQSARKALRSSAANCEINKTLANGV
jgi:hypothetical protein